ncbi:MAG TPA: thiamine phosphate synthase [Syntrophomonas sp.]|jgi:thiamine-phosphate pyrophosphorylase|nr:thiamine phosphate synthase [Syntrophomonas sp.]
MMNTIKDFLLYPILDTAYVPISQVETRLEEVIQGGASIIQLRDKTGTSRKLHELALKCREVTARFHIPLIINDRLDIAQAVKADGVHLGQDDLPVRAARKILGPHKIIGVSVINLEEARQGYEDGADYVSISPVFPTVSKSNTREPAGMEVLRQVKAALPIPVIAIGGIKEENLGQVFATGCDGVAVISAIFAQQNVRKATLRLRTKITEVYEGRRNI